MQFKKFINIAIFFVWIVFFFHAIGVTAQPVKGYYIENEKFKTWPDAFEFCKIKNMTLVAIRDQEEFEYLKTIIQQRYKKLLPYWIGAYRMEGIYRWLPSADLITNFFWHVGEPNDNSGRENCIHTWEGHFDWNDNDCERVLPFICEVIEN